MKAQRIDIIGAGIGGLATAWRLVQQSPVPVQLRIWDADSHVGGLAGTFSSEGLTAERFYHHLFRRDVHLIHLAQELGLGAALQWRPARTGAYYFRQPYSLSSPLDLLRFRPLPFVDRLRMGALVLHARTVRHWQALDDETAADYIRRVAGARVYNTVWQPLLQGKFGTYAEDVSAAWLWAKLVDRGSSRNRSGREELGYFRGGMGIVFQALADRIQQAGHELRLGQRVNQLETDSEGRVTALWAAGDRHPTDHVVATCHAPQLAALLPERQQAYAATLNRIAYLGNVCLVLALRQSLSQFYWTNVTDPAAPFVGIVEQTRWADRSDYGGHHLAYLSAYVPPGDTRYGMDAQALLEQYLPHIRNLFPHFTRAEVVQAWAWQAPYAQPIVTRGYRHLIPAIETPLPNLLLCTMAQIYPSDRQVSNGVALAGQTADLLCRRLAAGA